VERLLTTDAADRSRTFLTLIYPGGTAKTPSGAMSYGSNLDRPFDLQPHHRYVVFLRHFSSGDFYSLNQSWELCGGVVYPNSAGNVERAKAGTSLYSGTREDEFLAALPALVGTR
jgi:hypothetical protein